MKDLKHFKFFEYLDENQLKLLASFSKKKHFDKGSILFYEKDKPTSLILLIEGVLKVYKTDLKNNEIIMHRFSPMNMIAEMALLEGVPYPASAAFETDGAVIEVDFIKFKKEFLSDSDVAMSLFKSLSAKIKYLEDVIALNLVLDSTARLAKYLCDNSQTLNGLKNYQLAEHLHMTPETLSRTFKKLAVLDLVSKGSSGYVIRNREGLKALFE